MDWRRDRAAYRLDSDAHCRAALANARLRRIVDLLSPRSRWQGPRGAATNALDVSVSAPTARTDATRRRAASQGVQLATPPPVPPPTDPRFASSITSID